MKITKALKEWLVANCSAKADADDDDFRKATGDAFATGKLTADGYQELTRDPLSGEAKAFAERLDKIADGLTKAVEAMKPAERVEAREEKAAEVKEEKKVEVKSEKRQPSRLGKLFAGMASVEDTDDIEVRVKEAAEQYGTTKSAMTYTDNRHGRMGQPVMDFSEGEGSGRQLDHPSQLDRAVVGAYGKFLVATAKTRSRNLAWMSLPDHDRELILHAMEKMKWSGSSDDSDQADIVCRKLTPHEQKTVIDDAVSGGISAVPMPFDDQIISAPILQGEFYPLVNVVPIDKGRRIMGAAAGQVTGAWGGVDATAIALFNTAAYVAAFNTTIFRWEGAIRVGLDFLSDTPIDFAQFLTTQYGEVLARDLDTVICVGNGTTQPTGIMVGAGTTVVAFGGATTIGAYETLRFGVHKRELAGPVGKTAVFGGTDTSYQRAISIPVGAADFRRLANTTTMANYDGYVWMGRPYKICSTTMTNAQIFFAVLGRYRMYRRRGFTIRNSVEGDTLIRNNEMLITATARYGGALERGACAAITTTAPV